VPVKTDGPYPRTTLTSLDGAPVETVWPGEETLLIHGHRNCKTTRQTLPYVDRIQRHKTRGRVVAVLQDDRETAETLVREQALALPVLLEAEPYPLAAAVSLEVVPTLFLIRADGTIEKAVQAWNRGELEAFAARLGVPGPFFTADDNAPATRPGCVPKEKASSESPKASWPLLF
jgi:hypothetical protein